MEKLTVESDNSYQIIGGQDALRGAQKSGYKSTAHTVAELIDNSIQAGELAKIKNPIVEVICIEQKNVSGRLNVSEIIVADNCGGMTHKQLLAALAGGKGTHKEQENHVGTGKLGKFGYGLPYASLNTCLKTDVYSWQNEECNHSFINVQDIIEGQTRVPVPTSCKIPERYNEITQLTKTSGGTLVVWSNLLPHSWKKSSTLFDHVETLIGRIYRNFISGPKPRVTINLKAVQMNEHGSLKLVKQSKVKPVDPLFLMHDCATNLIADGEPLFVPFDTEQVIDVVFQDKVHKVVLKGSVARKATRAPLNGLDAGNQPHGKDCLKHIGVSIVRSGRELELNQAWSVDRYRDRWWAIQVEFEPGLDDLFNVAFTKQSASALMPRTWKDEAALYDDMDVPTLKESLEQEDDPQFYLIEIADKIDGLIKQLRGQLVRTATPTSPGKNKKPGNLSFGTRDIGGVPENTDELLEQTIAYYVDEAGYSEENAKNIAQYEIKKAVKWVFNARHVIDSDSVFAPEERLGRVYVNINSGHPAFEGFADILTKGEHENHPLRTSIGLMFAAWAQMENEAARDNEQQLDQIRDVRRNWGKNMRKFFNDYPIYHLPPAED